VAVLLAAVMLSGCERLSLLVANLPARTAERRGDLSYAPGPRGRFDAYLPPQAAQGGAARPLVIFWYGGGFTDGERTDYRFVGAALSGAGFVTVLPDYRLYPQVRFPQFLEDAARAVVAAHAQAGFGGEGEEGIGAGEVEGLGVRPQIAPFELRLADEHPDLEVKVVLDDDSEAVRTS
jgi:acetyl esterase/lipase